MQKSKFLILVKDGSNFDAKARGGGQALMLRRWRISFSEEDSSIRFMTINLSRKEKML